METTQSQEHIEKSKNTRNNAAVLGFLLIAVIVVIGGFYLLVTRNQIYTDKAQIEAPEISIAPEESGTLQKMLVQDGDTVEANTPVAQVADQILRATQSGIITNADNNVGKTINSGSAVVSMIHPEDLRVVSHIDEDKGLNQIKVGQAVSFTADAFGSKKFTGVVDEISASARQSGVVFNISDQREVQQFDVKIRYDVHKYPELKNGMSAKVTIFTK